jgi:hypothetical protein
MWVGSLLQGRTSHTATLLSDSTVLIAGGYTYFGTGSLNSAEVFDPSTGISTQTAPMNDARSNFTATLLADGGVLVVGGFNVMALGKAEIYR